MSRTSPRVIWLQAIFNPLKRCHVSKQHDFFSISHPCLSERTESHAKAFAIRVCTFSHFSEKKEFKHRSSRQTHVCHGLQAKQKQKQQEKKNSSSNNPK